MSLRHLRIPSFPRTRLALALTLAAVAAVYVVTGHVNADDPALATAPPAPQVEVAEPITVVLKLIVDDQRERSVDRRGDIHASASQRREDAMVQRLPDTLVEVRGTRSGLLQVDGPDIL